MTQYAKRTFKKGETIIRAGERGDCAYVVEQGTVEIIKDQHGQSVQIGVRGPGSIIGEMAMIDDKPRTATVRAVEDCTVMEISRGDFTRRLEGSDPVIKMVMHIIMTRYRDLIGRTQILDFKRESAAEALENLNQNHAVALGSIKVLNELKTAIDKKQLTLWYQPIIDLKDFRVAGFEALMRWKHPERGMISPGIFIPVAEETGLIVEMSRWALEQSCDAVKELQKVAMPGVCADGPLFISVNFSVKDFAAEDVHARVKNTLEKKSVTPAQIHMEITESLLMGAPEAAKTALEKCRDMGVGVSIDDFGSGYSSLSYLHSFPIDTLKIDQSFIRAMSQHSASMALVRSIVALAKNLDMHVIAEGIEHEKEAKALRALGVEQAQGYWFAKPMPLDDALKFAATWKAPALPA